jgi:hypothetical protein
LGDLYDRAVAKAESILRKKILGNMIDCDALTADYDGDLRPTWITFAAEYVNTVVKESADELLDPSADNPDECINRINHLPREIAGYLFRNYFSTYAESWNVMCLNEPPRPNESRVYGPGGEPPPIDEEVFYLFFLTLQNAGKTTQFSNGFRNESRSFGMRGLR